MRKYQKPSTEVFELETQGCLLNYSGYNASIPSLKIPDSGFIDGDPAELG